MNMIICQVLLGIFFLGLYNLTHVLVSRFAQPPQRWRAMKIIFFIFLPIVAGSGFYVSAHSALPERGWPVAIATLLIIWLIHVGYLTAYAFIDRSITLRTFIEIESFGGKPATFKEIESRYNPVDAFERRLTILIESGFLEETNGHLVLTMKGRKTGRLIRFLKEIYRAGPGG